jgi:sigma-B regulation protein RsbU (phosphoserine phosphatase)
VAAPASDDGFPEDDIRLDAGSLYVFTAGLPEARTCAGERLGADGVERLVAALRTLPLAARLTAIAEHAAPGPLTDDITVLAVDGGAAANGSGTAAGEVTQRLLDLRVPASARELKQVRDAVRQAALGGGCSPACADDVVIAIDEACQNVIRHAYGGDPGGEMVLEVERHGDRLVVWLRDFARSVDASTVQPRDLDEVRPGGLGVHLIREVMDESDFIPCPSGNILRMVKRIR